MSAPPRPTLARRIWIIDSLKNDEELALLRSVYQGVLLVFGVFAPEHVRKRRLKRIGLKEANIGAILDRIGRSPPYGQRTRTIFSNSDFFVRNDQDNDSELRRLIQRFLDLSFDVGIHTPTSAESAMHEADSVANRSGCMSRQVGAAIVDGEGSLISVGWNDVPKFGGGLYVEDDQWSFDEITRRPADLDHRCFRWADKICHNDAGKKQIRADLVGRLRSAKIVNDECNDNDIFEAIKGSRVDSLIEFSRSVHAEMEAILAVARDARHSLDGATLYTYDLSVS